MGFLVLGQPGIGITGRGHALLAIGNLALRTKTLKVKMSSANYAMWCHVIMYRMRYVLYGFVKCKANLYTVTPAF